MQLAIDDAIGKVSRQRYLPYGQRRGGRDDLPFTDRGFLGKVEDDSTGLDYLSARYYDPASARFVSPDPLLDLTKPGWANPYSYAGNNPIGLSDPSGLAVVKDGGGGACHTAAQCASYDYNTCVKKFGDLACAEAKLKQAKAAENGCWNTFIQILKQLGDVILEEMGIKSGLDCVLKGDLKACGDTAINIITSFIGGAVGRLALKYGVPWKWAEGAKIAKKVIDLGKRAKEAFDKWAQANDLTKKAENIYQAAVKKCKNSFVSGTLVLMADGTYKPIDQVKVGDLVLAADPVTGETSPQPVLAVIGGNGDKTLVHITVDLNGDQGGKTGAIIATDDHPSGRRIGTGSTPTSFCPAPGCGPAPAPTSRSSQPGSGQSAIERPATSLSMDPTPTM
ncbi:RHS repeat-associated core domain-containing protein [Thermoactinospora rubra]|uniref:RHS repeat-associated core domain-containing protein n=1 Tax=Thermoactinospora rubra TaxID=1088767 RepID=UPI000A0F5824|nr:RHS repeat-associated core domain-containing protein [Thermoactinospora rubra]